MKTRLQEIRERVTGKKTDSITSLYCVIKELHCLPDVIGREYEVDYDSVGRVSRIRQLPMSIPTLNLLMKELEKDIQRQRKEMERSKRKK